MVAPPMKPPSIVVVAMFAKPVKLVVLL
uniref:Uncharacterized protein n=1 Tax=Rhizophora mucronata TaxID=61149 RepID=A0A2P2QJJ9_RHIMU